MSDTALGATCRLAIRAPGKAVDLAVPSDIPLADLLPVIVGQAGDNLDEEGLEHEGWVLQRIGGEPLDEEATVEDLNLREGEVLLLRPRTQALPVARYDNLVDAVSTTMRDLPFAWTPAVSRWTLRLMVTGLLCVCWALLVMPGPLFTRLSLAAGFGLLVLAGAGAAARVLDDRPGGVLLGLVGSGFLALGGVLTVGDPLAGQRTHHLAGAELLAGSAAGAVGTVLAAAVVGVFAVFFAAAAVLYCALLAGGALMLLLDIPFSEAAAGMAAIAVVFGAFVPRMSFSLAGFRLPPLPTNAEQLQEGIEPRSDDEISGRARATDHWMSGFYLAAGAVCCIALVAMSHRPDTAQTVTSAVLATLLALHARNLGTAWHRLASLVPAGVGIPLVIWATAHGHGPDTHVVAAALLLLTGAALAVVSWTVPGRRLLPHWGRAGDLLQSATAIALLPVVLWTLGVYQQLRALNG